MPPSPSRRVARRSSSHRLLGFPVAALAAVSLLAPAGAQAATHSSVSPVTGMQVQIDGVRVTVSPGATPSTAFLRSVEGKTVMVECFAGFQNLYEAVTDSPDGPMIGPFDASFLGGSVHWPAGASSVSYELPRDVSETVDGCAVGRALATTVGFSAQGQALVEEDLGAPRLMLAHRAAKDIARARTDRRFPSARQLTAQLARSEPQMKIGYAKSIVAARRNNVVYVIEAGTDEKFVRLIHRENDGQPIRLVGRRRGEPLHLHHPHDDVPVPAPSPGDRRNSGRD